MVLVREDRRFFDIVPRPYLPRIETDDGDDEPVGLRAQEPIHLPQEVSRETAFSNTSLRPGDHLAYWPSDQEPGFCYYGVMQKWAGGVGYVFVTHVRDVSYIRLLPVLNILIIHRMRYLHSRDWRRPANLECQRMASARATSSCASSSLINDSSALYHDNL